MRALQWLKIFAAVFIMKINKNNSRFKVSLAMKIIFLKNEVFDHFSQILTDRHTKASHFIFQKWYCFWERYFQTRKSWLKIHFGHIRAKSKSLLTPKIDWKKSLRTTDGYLSFRLFAANFLPKTFLISWIFQVYRIKYQKDIKSFSKFFFVLATYFGVAITRTPWEIKVQIY